MRIDRGTALTPDGAALSWEASGSGPPVLLVSGQAVTRRSWDDWVPVLAASFRVVMFDHRGIGPSTEGAAPPRTTRGFASDAVAVLHDAGVERAHVVGHSMGGRVGQWIALDSPAAVDRLVLIATTAGDARGHRRSPEATADLASGDPARLGPRFFGADHLVDHPGAIEVFTRPEGSVRTRRRHFEASSTHDTWGELARIAAPTLVVHGTDDSITPEANGRELAARIPGARYLPVVGGRHGVQLDASSVLDAVLTFLGAPEWDPSQIIM